MTFQDKFRVAFVATLLFVLAVFLTGGALAAPIGGAAVGLAIALAGVANPDSDFNIF